MEELVNLPLLLKLYNQAPRILLTAVNSVVNLAPIGSISKNFLQEMKVNAVNSSMMRAFFYDHGS